MCIYERVEAKHDGHATQAATEAATIAAATACVPSVTEPPPLSPLQEGVEAEVVQPESKEEEQKEKEKKKKKKKKKTLTKTAEGCEVDSGQETCRQMLAEIDRGRANGEEITETLLLLQKSLQRWCARHPEMLDEPFLDQLEVMGKVHALVESKVLRRSERLQTAPPDGSV